MKANVIHLQSRIGSIPPGVLALLVAVASALFVGGCAGPKGPDTGPLFFPPPPQRPRIQFLTAYTGARDIEGETSSMMKYLVGDNAGDRRLRKPTAVAAYGSVIYVVDPGWDTVIAIDLEQKTFDTIADRGVGKLNVPVAIAIDEAGNKFIADSARRQVVEFNERNEFVRVFGNPETLRPTGVAVDERYLYVVNRKQYRVEIYERASAQQLETFGEYGAGNGQFNIPTSLARDERGHLFVTDAANFRVQEFDKDGEFIQSYGSLGDRPGTFARPRGLSLDREGHLYTVDAAFENVQIWDTSNAHVLLAFGGSGVRPGDMYLPASVFVTDDLNDYFREYVDPDFELAYVVLVANNYGPNKLAVYGFVNPKDPSQFPEYPLPDDESEGGEEGENGGN